MTDYITHPPPACHDWTLQPTNCSLTDVQHQSTSLHFPQRKYEQHIQGHQQREFKPVLQCAHARPNLLWIKPQARASLCPGYVSFLRGGIASDVAHQLLDVTHSLLNDCVGRFQDWSNWKINSCNFRITVFEQNSAGTGMLHVPHLPCPKRMVDLAAWRIITLKRSTDWHLRISVGQFWNKWDKSLSLTVNISDAKHYMSRPTLFASLSSTLLQTLP